MCWSLTAFLSATKPNLQTQHIFHGLGSFFLRCCCNMGIGVQGEASREVAQHAGDGFDIHAVLEGERGEDVAEVMEANPRDTRSIEDSL